MFRVRHYAWKGVAALLAVQLCATPAVADFISFNSGGFIIIGTRSSNHYERNKHKVHRYYAAPHVYIRTDKPGKHKVGSGKKHRRFLHRQQKSRTFPYYIQKRYGIQHHKFSRYK